MKKIITITFLMSSIILSGCNTSSPGETCSLTEQTGNSCTDASPKSSTPTTTETSAIDTAKAIVQSLKNKDIQTLITYINPATKVRFSPYSYVNTDTDITMNAQELVDAFQDTGKIITRGIHDGSGEPINLTTQEYFQKFIYDLDFLNAPEINENKEIMRGNIINNVFDTYKDTEIIEFYIPGIDPKYDGMDRRSLTIVLKKTDGERVLIGIIHNQRTI